MIADLKYFPEDVGPDGDPLPEDQQPTLDDGAYRRLILKAVPTAWLNNLTNNGADPTSSHLPSSTCDLSAWNGRKKHYRSLAKGSQTPEATETRETKSRVPETSPTPATRAKAAIKRTMATIISRESENETATTDVINEVVRKAETSPDTASAIINALATTTTLLNHTDRMRTTAVPNHPSSNSNTSSSFSPYPTCFMIDHASSDKTKYCHPLDPKRPKRIDKRRRKSALLCDVLPIDSRMEATTTTALLDTGSTASFIHHKLIPRKYWRKCCESPFETKGGEFHVKHVVAVDLMLPELSTTRTVRWTFYINPSDKPQFGILLGSNFLEQNQFDISYSKQSIEWDGTIASMHAETLPELNNALHFIREGDENDPNTSEPVKATARRATKILDAKYEKADLEEVVNKITTLNSKQKKALLKLLRKFESLFDGTLGDFDCAPADIELKPGHDQPYHARTAFSVPRIHRQTLHKENK